jgi:uncharacterized protein (DUF111 family)
MLRVEIPWGQVGVKVKFLDGKPIALSPEYDDCARIASETGIPLAKVMETAIQQAAAQAGKN